MLVDETDTDILNLLINFIFFDRQNFETSKIKNEAAIAISIYAFPEKLKT